MKLEDSPRGVLVVLRRRLVGFTCDAIASRFCWKACCSSLCCSSARRAIFLSGPSMAEAPVGTVGAPMLVSSLSRSCSKVAARASCWWPNARARGNLPGNMEAGPSSGTTHSDWIIMSDHYKSMICTDWNFLISKDNWYEQVYMMILKKSPQNKFNCNSIISNPLITPSLSAAKLQDESLKVILNIIKHNYDYIILGR